MQSASRFHQIISVDLLTQSSLGSFFFFDILSLGLAFDTSIHPFCPSFLHCLVPSHCDNPVLLYRHANIRDLNCVPGHLPPPDRNQSKFLCWAYRFDCDLLPYPFEPRPIVRGPPGSSAVRPAPPIMSVTFRLHSP